MSITECLGKLKLLLENVRISEDMNCFLEHCAMPFQAVTVVTKLLVSLA